MLRIIYILSAAIIAGMAGLIGFNILSSPVEARRDSLEFQLENAQSAGSLMQVQEDLNYEEIQYAIAAKPNLWSPLTEAAKAAAKPPDLGKMLEGVAISRRTVGSGDQVKISIITPDQRAGQWVGIGDMLRGLKVKSIDARSGRVVFATTFQGREYTYTLTR